MGAQTLRALSHGLSRGVISIAQGGTFKSGFASGFASSLFSPGTSIGGNGAGGFTLRTTIASIVGGTASSLGGGKFSNGAVSGAFVHMFNAEGLAEQGMAEGIAMLRSQSGGLEDNIFMFLPFGRIFDSISYGVKYISQLRFIGRGRGGRIFQIMQDNQPIFRLDKAPVIKGSKIHRLHWHRGLSNKTMRLHRPYDTWLKGIKDWKY